MPLLPNISAGAGVPDPLGPPTDAPGEGRTAEAIESDPLSIPPQGGIMGEGRHANLSHVAFEDFFPSIELDEDEKSSLVQWFDKDLLKCVKNVNRHRPNWGLWRAVFMLEYVQKFYPDIEFGADFSSGLLCEKALGAINHMKKAFTRARPLFNPDVRATGSAADMDMLYRAAWFLDSVCRDELKVMKMLIDGPLFDYVLDGSAIIEADTVYDKVPHRTLKTYRSIEELEEDVDRALSDGDFQRALSDLQSQEFTQMLIESEIVVHNGLQLFHVDKVDHLVPDGVYSDEDIRFRARRMYLTRDDLELLAGDDTQWYDKDAVKRLVECRQRKRELHREWKSGGKMAENARVRLNDMERNGDLVYDWQRDEVSLADTTGQPYDDVFAIYRVTCKYAYQTKSDTKGVIPKYCIFDYSPEGQEILRSVTYPHFTETRNWFHMKLGHAPKSYYGLGYGALLVTDDSIESNAVDLYLTGASIAVMKPMIFRHPEAGGRYPWHGGFHAAAAGFVNDPNTDVKDLDLRPPSDGMLRLLLPLASRRAENRTGITSLVQGRTETTDPRSPAAKTAMLLQAANVPLDMLLEDWAVTGWNDLGNYIWEAKYENAMYLLSKGEDDIVLGDLITREEVPDDSENQVSLKELGMRIKWVSATSNMVLDPQARMEKFLRGFQFIAPLLKEMANMNPQLYQKYFMRWLRRAGQEIDLPGMEFLIPTMKEIQSVPANALARSWGALLSQLQGAQGSVAQPMQTSGQEGGGVRGSA